MNPTREELLFGLALTKPATERPAFLDRECAGDSALRQRIEALLAAHEKASGFLPADGGADTVLDPSKLNLLAHPTDESEGSLIGRYKLLEKLGEGGFGAVWLAEQKEPVRRKVALKIIKLGMDTKQVVARFEAERQALALMDHPNIAKVLDAGTTDNGRPYFVMELVRGIPLTKFCDENLMVTRDRLDLFVNVCHAIQHAHQKGIIHRDIKPSNVLVTLHDGVPVPKVIDFGIAKATQGVLTDKTIHTQFQQFIGTPAYMSPEQAEMSGLDIDTRADIYSLGVLLYELLVGSTPFDAKELMSQGIDAMRKTIREKEPVRPSTKLSQMLVAADVRRLKSPSSVTPVSEEEVRASSRRLLRVKETITLLRGDLDWIVMKCLEKDRTRRYETANGIAADLKRHFNNEPVVARPPSATYRFQKAFRRNKLVFTAATVVGVALVSGIGVSSWQAVRAINAGRSEAAARLRADVEKERAEKEAQRAKESELLARQNLYAADMNLVHRALQEGDLGRARQLLKHYNEGASDLIGFEYPLFRQQAQGDQFDVFDDYDAIVNSVVFVPHKNRQFVVATVDGRVAVQDLDSERAPVFLTTRREIAILMHQVAVSPDGSILASAGKEGIELWNLMGWSRIAPPDPSSLSAGQFSSLCFSPNGLLAAGRSRSGVVYLWNTADWSIAAKVDCGANQHGRVLSIIDNRRLAVAAGRKVEVWELGDRGQPVNRIWKSPDFNALPAGLLAHGGYLTAISGPISPGDTVQFKVWNLENFELVASRDGAHSNFAFDLCLSPDGTRILSAGGDQLIKVWTFPRLEWVDTLLGHGNEVWALSFSSDGKTLASGGKDGTVRLWQFERSNPDPNLTQLPSERWMSEDGTRFLAAEGGGVFAIRDAVTGSLMVRLESEGEPFAFSGAGNLLFWRWDSADDRLVVERFAPVTGGRLGSLKYDEIKKSTTRGIVGSGDGRRLAVERSEGCEVWETEQVRRILRYADPDSGAIRAVSSSGDYLVTEKKTSNWEGILKIWHISDARPRKVVTEKYLEHVILSPREDVLAASHWEKNAVVLWNLRTGEFLSELIGHTSSIAQLAFSPDGRTLISRNRSNTRLWQVATSREIARVEISAPTLTPRLSLVDRVLGRNLSGNVEFWRVTGKNKTESSNAKTP